MRWGKREPGTRRERERGRGSEMKREAVRWKERQ
jgi:hypothetical protein